MRVVILLAIVAAYAGCSAVTPATELRSKPSAPEAIQISPAAVWAAEPAITFISDDKAVAAYVEHLPDGSANLYVQPIAGERPAGTRVRVNPIPGEVKSWKGDPPTITADAKAVYVAWNRKVERDGAKGNDLMVSISDDGGTTFDAAVKVNDDEVPASHGMHSLALGSNGQVYVAWLDERSLAARPRAHHPEPSGHAGEEGAEPNSEVYFAASADGGKTFSPNRLIAKDVCPCCKTSVLVQDTTLYISWRQVLEGDHRHIAVARSDDHGGTFHDKTIVSDDAWQISACPVSGAAMTGEKGRVDVVWYTAGAAGQPGLYHSRSDDSGQSFGPRTLVSNAAAAGTPVLFAENDRYSALFGSKEGSVSYMTWDRTASAATVAGRIDNAVSPVAAMRGGRLLAAFVRAGGKQQSVWVQRF